MTNSAGAKWQEALSDQAIKSFISQVKSRDEKIGAFIDFDPARGKLVREKFAAPGTATGAANGAAAKSGALADLPFAAKDNIAVRNFRLTCASKILANFVSPYSATAVEKLLAAGAVPVGKTNLDEFGMGSSCDNSALKQTNNPWDLSRVPGGSSGGSAAAVAGGLVPFALGSDTGGSVRQPAAFCGVYGLKPTYGAVSRYGLVAYASSLECIGVFARDVNLMQTVFETIRDEDPRDQSTVDWKRFADKSSETKTIAILGGELGLSPAVKANYLDVQKTLAKLGYRVVQVDLPILEYAVPAYYTIATAEASANLARFNGVRYGHRPVYSENPEELVRKSRDEGFGPEVKLRILLGTYVLRSGFQDQYYHKAQKIRTAIRNEISKVFGDVDALMLPVFPTQAYKREGEALDGFQQKMADRFTPTANLTGQPGLTVPTGVENGLPHAVQFMAPHFAEERLFGIAAKLAGEYPLASPGQFGDLYATVSASDFGGSK